MPGLAINVRDQVVRDSLMTLTTLDPPVAAVVSLWTQQSYGDQVRAASGAAGRGMRPGGGVPVLSRCRCPRPTPRPGSAPPAWPTSHCCAGPMASTRQPAAALAYRPHTWWPSRPRRRSGYTQNAVVRALKTPGAPVIAAIVEESFPIEAVSDLHAFFGAADITDDLRTQRERMVCSTAAFGANQEHRHGAHEPLRVPNAVGYQPSPRQGEPMITPYHAVALAAAENGLCVVSTIARRRHHPGITLTRRGSAPGGTGQPARPGVRHLRQGEAGEPAGASAAGGDVPRRLAVGDRGGSCAELAGPDDPQPWLADADQLRLLLREGVHRCRRHP